MLYFAPFMIFPVPVMQQTRRLRNIQLLGQMGDNYPWYCSRLRKEGSQKTDGAKLKGVTEAIVVTSPNCDLRTIPVVQLEIPRQLSGSRISIICMEWSNTSIQAATWNGRTVVNSRP